MKTLNILFLLISFMNCLAAQVVQTQFGKIQGRSNGNVYEYLGIPFARPPVDSLRWRAPQNPENWQGILQTTEYAPVCPQKRFEQGSSDFTFEGKEDCLYLNVWTPKTSSGNLPVLVFIHGGGNQQGGASQLSGNTWLYSGKNMCERGNAVVVTIQYRLGPLGFLVHPGLETENKNMVSGNYAVLDQILALEWIHNNIELFGGDPMKVMIFGESAGGVNVGNLLTTPMAKGLFQRACIQSASPVINDYTSSKNKGIAYVDSFITFGTDAEKIKYMRTLPADSLIRFETAPVDGGVVQMNWQSVVDKVIFNDFPKRVFESGNFNRVPLIVGSNADEMSLMAPQTVLPLMVTALVNSTIPSVYQAEAHNLYPSGTNSAEARKSFVAILTDVQFTSNARRTAQCISNNQTEPVWRYFFTHKHTVASLESLGSYHGMELFYVFNNWENTLLGSGALFKPEDRAVQDVMLKYWINFANTGNPNGDNLANWPRYSSSMDNYLEIKAVPDGNQNGVRTAKCDFWDKVAGYSGCSTSVGLSSTTKLKPSLIYPNPANHYITIKLTENKLFETTIYNATGQKVHWSAQMSRIDISDKPDGVYLVEIKTDSDVVLEKFLKRNY